MITISRNLKKEKRNYADPSGDFAGNTEISVYRKPAWQCQGRFLKKGVKKNERPL